MVAMANENFENGIDSGIVDSSPNKWLDLRSKYDLNAEGVYDNDESVDKFVCMAYNTGGSEDEDEQNNDSGFQEHKMTCMIVLSIAIFVLGILVEMHNLIQDRILTLIVMILVLIVIAVRW